MPQKGKSFKYTSAKTKPKYTGKRAKTEAKRKRLRNKKGCVT